MSGRNARSDSGGDGVAGWARWAPLGLAVTATRSSVVDRRAPAAAASAQVQAGRAQTVKALLEDGTAKIRVAEMTVSVARGTVPTAADRASAIAVGVGGEVDSDDRSSGTYATAALQLR